MLMNIAFRALLINCSKKLQKILNLVLTSVDMGDILNFVVEEQTRQRKRFEKIKKVVDKRTAMW